MTPITWCAVHQPNLFPRVSTLVKIYMSDVYVPFKNVQFTQRDFQHRFRVSGRHDHANERWFTVPVELIHGQRTLLSDVRIVDPVESARVLHSTIRHDYGLSPGWVEVDELAALVIDQIRSGDLIQASITSTLGMLTLLQWKGLTFEDQVVGSLGRTERLIRLTSQASCHGYLCGMGGRSYLEQDLFLESGLALKFVNYRQFSSLIGDKWRSQSSLDLLGRSGLEGFRAIIHECATIAWQW